MDQIERLLSTLTPGTISIIKEQIVNYGDSFKNQDDLTDSDKEDQSWCDRVSETCDQMIKDKS